MQATAVPSSRTVLVYPPPKCKRRTTRYARVRNWIRKGLNILPHRCANRIQYGRRELFRLPALPKSPKALATNGRVMRKSGKAFHVRELAGEYGFTDIDGG